MNASKFHRPLWAFIAGVLLAGVALAHGPQIQVGIHNDKIITRALFGDGPYDDAVAPAQRVFEMPMALRDLGDANDGWYAQPNASFPFTGPGIATALGGFDTGSVLSLTYGDGLAIWDGMGFVDPGDEQMERFRSAVNIITSDAGPFDSFDFPAVTNTGDEHFGVNTRLLGDGISPDTASDDGVYLLTLVLETDQPGVEASDPFYFLLNKNGSQQDADAALAYVNTNIVPEPTSIGALIVAGALLARRRRTTA